MNEVIKELIKIAEALHGKVPVPRWEMMIDVKLENLRQEWKSVKLVNENYDLQTITVGLMDYKFQEHPDGPGGYDLDYLSYGHPEEPFKLETYKLVVNGPWANWYRIKNLNDDSEEL